MRFFFRPCQRSPVNWRQWSRSLRRSFRRRPRSLRISFSGLPRAGCRTTPLTCRTGSATRARMRRTGGARRKKRRGGRQKRKNSANWRTNDDAQKKTSDDAKKRANSKKNGVLPRNGAKPTRSDGTRKRRSGSKGCGTRGARTTTGGVRRATTDGAAKSPRGRLVKAVSMVIWSGRQSNQNRSRSPRSSRKAWGTTGMSSGRPRLSRLRMRTGSRACAHLRQRLGRRGVIHQMGWVSCHVHSPNLRKRNP